jgi:spore coat protein U-like protein
MLIPGKPRVWLVTALMLLSVVLPVAHAQSCNVGGTALSFGRYSSLDTAGRFGLGNVSVTCFTEPTQVSVSFTVALSAGNAGSLGGSRLLRLGANSLQYQLFSDVGFSTVWGDGTGGTSTVAGVTTVTPGFGSAASLPVYGRITAGQNVPKGVYTDTLVITLTY